MLLQKVGINRLTRPITIRTKGGAMQQTIADISLHAILPHEKQTSCLEVMLPLFAQYTDDLHTEVFSELLSVIKEQLQAKEVDIQITFPYFITKKAPVTSTASLMEYRCTLVGNSETSGSPSLTVHVPITTLCPCSKEISSAGAHNQRAEVTLTIHPSRFIWLEDLIDLVEQSGSCEVYALLKRPDEKYVTEKAFANPMFVEDVARKIAEQMLVFARGDRFTVGVESFESIHKHSAYAYIDGNDLIDLQM